MIRQNIRAIVSRKSVLCGILLIIVLIFFLLDKYFEQPPVVDSEMVGLWTVYMNDPEYAAKVSDKSFTIRLNADHSCELTFATHCELLLDMAKMYDWPQLQSPLRGTWELSRVDYDIHQRYVDFSITRTSSEGVLTGVLLYRGWKKNDMYMQLPNKVFLFHKVEATNISQTGNNQ